MTGDQADMGKRIRAVLPTSWFPDTSPVLDSLLNALGWAWAWLYFFIGYVKAQTRIATASGVWLDMIALDYFGNGVGRRPAEPDDALRARILAGLVRQRGTRAAVTSAVADVSGRLPAIFEPALTTDTGGWGGASDAVTGFAYGAAGGWGSLAMPFQFFVTAFRPAQAGAGDVGGWGAPVGGYGEGAVEYEAGSDVSDGVDNAAINAAIADVLPVSTTAWTKITS